MIHTEA
jgi:hypothetical protein